MRSITYDSTKTYAIDELKEKIATLAPLFFDHHGKVQDDDARAEIRLAALAYVERVPYDPRYVGRSSGRSANVNTYIGCVLAFCKDAYFKHAAQVQTRSVKAYTDLASIPEDLLRVYDPITAAEEHSRRGSLNPILALGAGGPIGTPPWLVDFTTPSDPAQYRTNPLYVPPFDLLPANPDKPAVRTSLSGRRLSVHFDGISYSQAESLESHKLEFINALAAMFREYLYSYGFRTLKPELRGLVAAVNRDKRSLEEARQHFALSNRDFGRRINTIYGRGWRVIDVPRKGPYGTVEYQTQLLYHPAYDGEKGTFARRIL
jgi:hypothetical protein